MNGLKQSLLAVGVVAALATSPNVSGETYYVDASQTNTSATGTGSFSNAVKYVEQALQLSGAGEA